MVGSICIEGSASFFGKKETKKLYPWLRGRLSLMDKSFLLLFFKKEVLRSYDASFF
jgi:hypothetical protein